MNCLVQVILLAFIAMVGRVRDLPDKIEAQQYMLSCK